MKQMYKVFINEKEIRFLTDRAPLPMNGKLIESNLRPNELVELVRSNQHHGVRIFFLISSDPTQLFEKFLDGFHVIRASGGVVRLQHLTGEILMIHRLGKWDLPKGKVDPGEGQEAAALREVREECGIRDLKIVKKLTNTFHMYELKGKWVVKMTYWYLMLSNDTGRLSPQAEEGITEVKWVNEKDVYFLLPYSYASIADLLANEILHR
jgi:8-oxo-dGTP pyrophosphatase MutT (NUDIX family)